MSTMPRLFSHSLSLGAIAGFFLAYAFLAYETAAVAQTETNAAPPVLQLDPFVAESIDGDPVSYPDGLDGSFNLVLLGFLRPHQDVLETWQAFTDDLATDDPAFAAYQVPVLAGLPGIAKFGIRAGFRRGVEDELRRRRLNLFFATDEQKVSLKESLDIATDDEAHAVLIDRQGTVLWRGTGQFTDQKGAELAEALRIARAD
jgi:hypothetical protein